MDKLNINFDLEQMKESVVEVNRLTPTPLYIKTFIPFQPIVEPNKNKKYHQLSLTKRPNSPESEWSYVRIKDGKTIKKYCDEYQQMMLRDCEGIEIDGFQKNSEYTEFVPTYNHTYFKEIHSVLSSKLNIGRMRLITYYPFQATEFYRDNEDKIIIPIESNDVHGHNSIKFILENKVAVIPEGEVWYVDTKDKQHMIANGGNTKTGVYLVISLFD